jgi:hypothetical protein
MPRAKAGGPCITGMPLTISDSSRQVGLSLVIMHFIRSTNWKAKQGAAGLFWCQNVYRELSQLPLRQLSE